MSYLSAMLCCPSCGEKAFLEELKRYVPTKQERGHRADCGSTWDKLALDYLGCTCKPPTCGCRAISPCQYSPGPCLNLERPTHSAPSAPPALTKELPDLEDEGGANG